jgi:epoxyqueuosine reductase
LEPKEGQELKNRLTEEARALGFAAMGLCRPDAIPEAMGRLTAFLDDDRHGEMDWMADRAHWRGDPAALWPEARSVIMLADSYAPPHDPLEVLAHPDRGAVSVYAQGKDYHDTIKPRLKRLLRWLLEQAPGAEGKVFVDTAPIMEKPLAQAAGLGWQGKHTNLLGRDFGNWVFLGAIFTTLELPPDAPEASRCGSCRRCLDACPTGAFPGALPARCPPLHLVSHHRAPRCRPAGAAPQARQPHLRLRRLPGRLPLEQVRRGRFRDALPARGWPAPARELAALDDTAFRARFAAAPSSGSAGRGSCAMSFTPSATRAAPLSSLPPPRISRPRTRSWPTPPPGPSRASVNPPERDGSQARLRSGLNP